MKTLTFATSLLLTLGFSTSAVLAQQAPPPAGQPGQVSTLEGQLVKVGDKNEYVEDFKRWNVSTNPIGMILGSYGASASYAPTSILAVRLDLNYYAPHSIDVKGFEVGLGAPIYFRKMYKGIFLEPAVNFRRVKADASEESSSVFGPSVSLGYHWYWDSGLNISAALGVGRNFADNKGAEFDDLNDIFATGYLRFGYAF